MCPQHIQHNRLMRACHHTLVCCTVQFVIGAPALASLADSQCLPSDALLVTRSLSESADVHLGPTWRTVHVPSVRFCHLCGTLYFLFLKQYVHSRPNTSSSIPTSVSF